LVKGEGYEHLAISSSQDAPALFARMARGEKSESECGKIRNDLIE